MKILLAAPEDNTVLGMISGYCRKAIESLGHEVSVFDFRKHPYSEGKTAHRLKSVLRRLFPSLPSPYDIPAVRSSTDKKINGLLLDKVSTFRPDVVLVFCGENIFAETIAKIKNKFGIITANWFHDSLLYPFRRDLVRFTLPIYDYLFLVESTEVLKHIDLQFKNIFTLPLACDPEIHNKRNLSGEESAQYGSDVVFVGTVTPEREKMLEDLADFDLKIWGRWERKSGKLKNFYRREVYADAVAKIYNASRVVIDMHCLFPREKTFYNVTPRVFEAPACGAFLLTNDTPQISDFYRVGSEIVTYKDAGELRSLIRYYLDHPEERKKIADAGFIKAHSEHTYYHRLKKLFSIIQGGR